jgi:hypothetical protein
MNSSLNPSEVYTNLVIALFVIPLIWGFFIKAPKLVLFSFIGVLFVFADSTWGQLQIESTIYSRGSGMFYFSLINLGLLAAAVAALFRLLANPGGPQLAPPMNKYFLSFLFLLFGHVVVGLIQGVELPVILGYNGMLNVVNMFLFMYLMIMAFDNERDGQQLMLAIIVLAAIRGVFGGLRYVLLGGDSANPYRNFEGMDVKIFYFDIGDNFIAALGAFCAAWLLTSPEVRLSLLKRALLFLFLLIEIAAVALSFRRSSLVGLFLMFLFLFLRIPGQRKLFFALAAGALLFVVATVFYQHRLQFASNQGGVLSSLIYDIISEPDIRYGRFFELWTAAQSMEGHWLLGRGTWGTFNGNRDILAFHVDFSFVHSGFGHIVLKTGLLGLALFCAMLASFVMFYQRHRNTLAGNARLMADTGFAGFLFWIPTLLIGTPIIEIRTMMLLGLTFALPFIAVGVRNRQVQAYRYQAAYAAA